MRALSLLVASLFVAGCFAGTPEVPSTEDTLRPARFTPAGTVAVDVAVDVVVLGFDGGVAGALAQRLEPLTVRMDWADDWVDVPPDAEREPHAPTFKDALNPGALEPTAVYRVADATHLLEAFLAHAQAARVTATTFDANAAEAWLAERLEPDANRPMLVLLHAGALGDGHAWRYAYENGHLEPVRVFGERTPLLVLDVSAAQDPAVTTRDDANDAAVQAAIGGRLEPVQAYDEPLAAGGDATVATLAKAVHDATRYRLLHGSAVAPPLEPCHAVTAILLVRDTSVSERVPLVRGAEELVDADGLAAGFTNLTGDPVRVDVRLLRLPQDDPELDALARPGGGAIGGTRGGYDALRAHVIANWDAYWVAQDGCAAYVSFVLVGDAADDGAALGGFSGIAMYDEKSGRRISFSVIADAGRLFRDGFDDEPGVHRFEPAMYLFAHETGHLFGRHHPHNVQDPDEGRLEHRSWQSVWTAESYQANHRTWDFGAIDHANQERNRAGFALVAAAANGHADSAAVAKALTLVSESEWRAAYESVLPLLSSDR